VTGAPAIDWPTAEVLAADQGYVLNVRLGASPPDGWEQAFVRIVKDEEHLATPQAPLPCSGITLTGKGLISVAGVQGKAHVDRVKSFLDWLVERADQQWEADRAEMEAARERTREQMAHREQEVSEMTDAFRKPTT
jgi:hypothetical protein